MIAWEDQFIADLPDPDEIGRSEYATLYQHVLDVIESAAIGGDDPKAMVLATLDEMQEEIRGMRGWVEFSERARQNT